MDPKRNRKECQSRRDVLPDALRKLDVLLTNGTPAEAAQLADSMASREVLLSDRSLQLARALRLNATVRYLAARGERELQQPNDRSAWRVIYDVLTGRETICVFDGMADTSPLKVVVNAILDDKPRLDGIDLPRGSAECQTLVELLYDNSKYGLLHDFLRKLAASDVEPDAWEKISHTIANRVSVLRSVPDADRAFGLSLVTVLNAADSFGRHLVYREALTRAALECLYGSKAFASVVQFANSIGRNAIPRAARQSVDEARRLQKIVEPLHLPAHLTEESVTRTWAGSTANPLVTIQCLTYNHAAFIRNAMDGFLMQKTDFPFNIVVHDDASSDDTQRILLEYRDRFPGIVTLILRDTNSYSSGSMREIIFSVDRASSGRYIAGCDGDDYWTDPHKLQKQVDYLESHADVAASVHNSALIDAMGNNQLQDEPYDAQKRDYTAFELKTKQAWLPVRALVYRSGIVKPDECFRVHNIDSFLTSLIGANGGSHYHDDILPSVYRVTESGIWSSLNEGDKDEQRFVTDFYMYKYYKKIGDSSVSGYLWKRLVQQVVRCHLRYHAA